MSTVLLSMRMFPVHMCDISFYILYLLNFSNCNFNVTN